MHHCNLLSLTHSGSPWITLALSLAHSHTFWLTLTHSGSLWLFQALISSQGACLALHVVDAWQQFIPACQEQSFLYPDFVAKNALELFETS